MAIFFYAPSFRGRLPRAALRAARAVAAARFRRAMRGRRLALRLLTLDAAAIFAMPMIAAFFFLLCRLILAAAHWLLSPPSMRHRSFDADAASRHILPA